MSDNKVLISRAWGIGDVCMSVPFVGHLINKGYDVTYETYSYDSLLKYFFPTINTINTSVYPDRDFRRHVDGYDYFVNLNRWTEDIDELAYIKYNDEIGKNLNAQFNYAIAFHTINNLPVPDDLSSGSYIFKEKVPTDDVLFFSKSSSPTRTLQENVVEFVKSRIPNVIVDPKYNNLAMLAEKINNAKLVIATDTGPLHIAECMSTKHIGLYTAMGIKTRTKYYKHGIYLQSTSECSPCNYHGRSCKNSEKFVCTKTFDFEKLNNLIKMHL